MRIRPILLLSALVVVAAGCGSGEPATPMSGAATTTTINAGPDLSKADFADETGKTAVGVKARDNAFETQYIEVSPGTKVTFTNEGEQPHNIKPANEGAFKPVETLDFEPTETTTITFDEPGEYSYYCSLHGTPTKGMTGSIRVVG